MSNYGPSNESPTDPEDGGHAFGHNASGESTWSGYDYTPTAAYVPNDEAPTAGAARSHRLRNSLAAAALLVVAAGGGIAVGRASAVHSVNAGSTSAAGGSSLVPGSSSGSAGGGSSSGGTGGSTGGSSGTGGFPGYFGGGSQPSPATGSGGSTGVGSGGGSLNASAIAAKVDPAVVDIDDVLGYQEEGAAGTGIVLTSTGEVLTNNHVVDGATSIRVTDINNGQTYNARVVGTDATADIAVIQLENASGLATANLGDSSTLTTGEAVLALGNAGGVGGTPSTAAGSVVALNQSITATDDSGANSEQLKGLVETNAPIEPGDSGGPLANSSAQVVAIDTAASSGNQYQSASTQAYAIPINTALTIARQIENGQGSTTIHIGQAGMLGVEVEPSGGASGVSSGPGAVIAAIIPGSPAAAAALTAGDVIVSLNGKSVASPSALSRLMERHHPGDRVTIGYDDSSSRLHSVSLTLAAGPPA
jgi:S1-C subfamily serine protease